MHTLNGSTTGAEALRFARFLAAGGAAAGLNFGSRFLFSAWLPYPAAVTLAYVVGLVTAFLLMRRYVFTGSSLGVSAQVLRFLGVNAIAFLQTLGISVLLVRWLGNGTEADAQVEAMAHAVGLVVPAITSYVGHRLATFR
jgi:putative flippase GtrA